MKRTAVLIGVNDYRDKSFADLTSPKADVQAIAAALSSNGHFDRVRPITNPTYAQATEVLEEVLVEGRPDDLVFISISGHGIKNDNGRLHLVFQDTRPRLLESSALSAERLHRMLEESRVGSKVLLLDCCYSGAFADGFATRSDERDSIDFRREISSGRGTYVLAASDALELANEGDNSQGIRPSPFSSAVAKGLSGEATDSNGDGWIDTQDLYQHVYREVHSSSNQQVTGFALELQGSIRLARHVNSLTATKVEDRTAQHQPEQGIDASSGKSLRNVVPKEAELKGSGPGAVPDAPWGVNEWRSLFSYYRSCLSRQEVLQQLPDVDGKHFAPCAMSAEDLISGTLDRWRVSGKALELTDGLKKNRQTLRYGYPAVLFDTGPTTSGARGRRTNWKVAPLIVMDVDLVEEGDERYIVPVDEPTPNLPVLMSKTDLDPAELEEILTWFRADLGLTGVAELGDKARSLCDTIGLSRIQDLVPGELRSELQLARPYRAGAQNVAMLYRVDAASTAAKQVLADLDLDSPYGLRPDQVNGTALAALTGEGTEVTPRSFRPIITGNSNLAQEEALRSSMTKRMTVVTGAPGTGKSELITSVVTTAVAAGQTVLVASTNNTAVDEVVNRANSLIDDADLIIRTGNQEHRQREPDILTDLLNFRPRSKDSLTASDRLMEQERNLDSAYTDLERAAQVENRLAILGPIRQRYADGLPGGLEPNSFVNTGDMHRWALRARKVLGRSWSRWWHRRQMSRAWGITATNEELVSVLRYLTVEIEWQNAMLRLARQRSPAEAHAEISELRQNRCADSLVVLVDRFARSVRSGYEFIDARLQALESNGSKWKGILKLLRAAPAWATTSRSVRGVFPPTPGLFDLVVVDEASQCTVADLIPLLYRAKRALVIGDPHQLEPVNNLDDQDDARFRVEAGLDAQWLDERSLMYTRSSAFHAAASGQAAAGEEVLWLDEHYRCHPDIVASVNRRFYGNRLAVRTRVDKLLAPASPAFQWLDHSGTPDRPGGTSCRNKTEAKRVIELLRELWTQLPPKANIGVVTPFRAQKRQLESLLGDNVGDRIRVGTVHTFQGGERDVIVISPAAATGVARGAGNWTLRQQNLWNVAVTRAKSRLYVVGDQEYWAGRGGVLGDLARTDRGTREEHDVDSPRFALFTALRQQGLETESRPNMDGYHCDLRVRTGSGHCAIVIDRSGVDEVPSLPRGRSLHRVLDYVALYTQLSGMPTVRVPAWRCIAEPEAVAQEIQSQGDLDSPPRSSSSGSALH